MLITLVMANQKIDDLFIMLILSNAILARETPPISENISGFVNTSANSVTFIDKTTAWFPANAKIITAINAIIPILINLPASGGG
jgi:hypothetical protein